MLHQYSVSVTFARMKEKAFRSAILPDEQGYSLLGDLVKKHLKQGGKAFILADENTYKHCMPRLLEFVPELTDAGVLEVEPGEASKDLDVVRHLWTALMENESARDDFFICLGGGMVSDLGGFTASAFKRGLRTIYIPTSLLAQADAAIGGKTAINFSGVKNLLGFFSEPEFVILDTVYLNTLPQRHLLSGMAEIIKLGIAVKKEIWDNILRGDSNDSEGFKKLILDSAREKERVCREDFYDRGERTKLNFGHTIGHMLESLSFENGDGVLHGEAVAAGMICETWIAWKKKLINKAEMETITKFISDRFPYVNSTMVPDQVRKILIQDKKTKKGVTGFVLPETAGISLTDQKVEEAMIMASLEFYKKLYGRTD